MYKVVVGVALLSIVSAGLSPAATSAQQGLEIGIWGGHSRTNEFTSDLTLCVLYTCRPTTMNPHFWRNAPTGGLMIRQQKSERLALRAEAVLAPKGFGPGDERSDWRLASQYLEIPLLAEIRMLRVGSLGLHLSGGLAPAVLVSCTVSGTTIDGFIQEPCAELNPVTGKSYGPSVAYDLGWAVAPGIRLPMGTGNLLLELRHTRGLIDTRPDAAGHTTNRSTAIAAASTWRVR
ncbi:hypothetical protein BH23GEM6_BH23GEM6_11780 [soil metagenome]